MDVDAVVSGILITFLGTLLLLQRLGVISPYALSAALPFILIVTGILVIYVGVFRERIG